MISTFHANDNYELRGELDVEPASEISKVQIIDANGGVFQLGQCGPGCYWGTQAYPYDNFPFGIAKLVIYGANNDSVFVEKNIINVIEQLPTLNSHQNNEYISDKNPTFIWDVVIDEQSSIKYNINVNKKNSGYIWGNQGLIENEVVFNHDNAAIENLMDNNTYSVETIALDTLGNASYSITNIKVGEPVVLENEYLSIYFNDNYPFVDKYIDRENDGIIYGELFNAPWSNAIVYYHDQTYMREPFVDSLIVKEDRVIYKIYVDIDSKKVATFNFTYVVEGKNVKVIFSDVAESEGCKFISYTSPNLITIGEDQADSKMIYPMNEGRLIDLKNSTTGKADIYLNLSSGTYYALTCCGLYHAQLGCLMSWDNLDLNLSTLIHDESDDFKKYASFYMKFNYRYEPTNFEKATFIDVFDEYTNQLSVDLTFFKDIDYDSDIDWIDAAKALRQHYTIKPEEQYLNSFIGKINTHGISSMDQHLNTVKRINNLTDNNKVYLYLLEYGPLYEVFGKDTDLWESWSQPALDTLIQKASELYNTTLSFHDVYNDYYPGTPFYDPALRAIMPDGSPMSGWPLDNYEAAYRIDAYDYMQSAGIERINSTLSRYPIKETYHLDVLSLVFPLDYCIDSPSSLERTRRGAQMIIDEFDKHGVDITSEGLTTQYAESGIGFFLDTPRTFAKELPFGNEQIIPFIEFLFHGKTLYGLYEDIFPINEWPRQKYEAHAFLDPLLLGANAWSHINHMAWDDLEIEKFYLIDLPWMMTNTREMNDYYENGSYAKMIYDDDTFVEIDYDANTYTVQVDGKIIGKDYSTVYPKSDSVILAYSKEKRALSIELPAHWNSNYHLLELSDLGPVGLVNYDISGNQITFNAKANTPYKLFVGDLPEFFVKPVIQSFKVNTSHGEGENWLMVSANVREPQGIDDIKSVVFIDPNNSSFSVDNAGEGNFYSRYDYGFNLPPLGECTLIVSDKSDNKDTLTTIVSNIIYNLPVSTFPTQGEKIQTLEPEFSWDEVTTEYSSINYGIYMTKITSTGHEFIWQFFNINGNKVKFNNDGSAVESLMFGNDYSLSIFANDSLGNMSFYSCDFSIDTLNTATVPVELYSFNGIQIKNSVELRWETSTESNNMGFDIERSNDNQHYTWIGFIGGKGTTANPETYSFTDKNVGKNKYFYRLKQIDTNGDFKYSQIIEICVENPTQFKLFQNYPNPFNNSTSFEYEVPENKHVIIRIYNSLGQEVRTLVNKNIEAGWYKVTWDGFDDSGNELPSGLYIYCLNSKDIINFKKCLLLK